MSQPLEGRSLTGKIIDKFFPRPAFEPTDAEQYLEYLQKAAANDPEIANSEHLHLLFQRLVVSGQDYNADLTKVALKREIRKRTLMLVGGAVVAGIGGVLGVNHIRSPYTDPRLNPDLSLDEKESIGRTLQLSSAEIVTSNNGWGATLPEIQWNKLIPDPDSQSISPGIIDIGQALWLGSPTTSHTGFWFGVFQSNHGPLPTLGIVTKGRSDIRILNSPEPTDLRGDRTAIKFLPPGNPDKPILLGVRMSNPTAEARFALTAMKYEK